MFGQKPLTDKELLKTVTQRLTRTGNSGSSRVAVAVNHGTVTLTGSLQYEIQRNPIIRAMAQIAGVKRVVDQMICTIKKKV